MKKYQVIISVKRDGQEHLLHWGLVVDGKNRESAFNQAMKEWKRNLPGDKNAKTLHVEINEL